MENKRVLVVGGGAAGIFAAIGAAQQGVSVLLMEKNKRLGVKILISGKGRCNITNSAAVEEVIRNIPGNGRFLYSALTTLSNIDLIDFFKKLGLETKIERGGRVFPVSDRARDVVKVLRDQLSDLNVDVKYNRQVTDVECINGHLAGVRCQEEFFASEAVVLATGGLSYPRTGSTGEGYEFAQKLGHQVTPLRPSLIPLETQETWVRELSGLTLKNVRVTAFGKTKLGEEFGEILFTHYGVSGPIILTLSRVISKALEDSSVKIEINLKPALDQKVLDQRILRDFEKYSRKLLKNALSDLLPQALILPVIDLSRLNPDQPVHQISRLSRQRLVNILQRLTLTVVRTRPITEAIVTSGGVSVTEVNPKTMASKLVDNLFFAGEILDIDGYTGGYNLQAAFSTGYLAGKSAARYLSSY